MTGQLTGHKNTLEHVTFAKANAELQSHLPQRQYWHGDHAEHAPDDVPAPEIAKPYYQMICSCGWASVQFRYYVNDQNSQSQACRNVLSNWQEHVRMSPDIPQPGLL